MFCGEHSYSIQHSALGTQRPAKAGCAVSVDAASYLVYKNDFLDVALLY
jgi:hypothetical protein